MASSSKNQLTSFTAEEFSTAAYKVASGWKKSIFFSKKRINIELISSPNCCCISKFKKISKIFLKNVTTFHSVPCPSFSLQTTGYKRIHNIWYVSALFSMALFSILCFYSFNSSKVKAVFKSWSDKKVKERKEGKLTKGNPRSLMFMRKSS